jgi:cysteinyl-tRNA synthetase
MVEQNSRDLERILSKIESREKEIFDSLNQQIEKRDKDILSIEKRLENYMLSIEKTLEKISTRLVSILKGQVRFETTIEFTSDRLTRVENTQDSHAKRISELEISSNQSKEWGEEIKKVAKEVHSLISDQKAEKKASGMIHNSLIFIAGTIVTLIITLTFNKMLS